MPAIYTYQKSLLDNSISNYLLSAGDQVATNYVDNTTTGTPVTHIDVHGAVYPATTAAGYLSLNLSVYDVYGFMESDDSAMQLDLFTIGQQYTSSNQMRFSVKDVKALPYYLAVLAKNVGNIGLYVTLRVYGRTFIFVNI